MTIQVPKKPYLIGIAGESGVGKSTIAEIVSLFYNINQTLILSTDDLHKWDRLNAKWKETTHLHPDSNNLDLGDIHLNELSQGKFIFRSHYNHRTGYFDPPQKIEPKPTIIIEGLHAFYTDLSSNLLDLKIFVDTDEDLRIHWKIIRDTEERGYTYNTALEAINKRKADSIKVREKQIQQADVIIKLIPASPIQHVGDKMEQINLTTSIIIQKEIKTGLIDFIKNYINHFNQFIVTCENLGQDIGLCQNGGGNISVKIGNYLIIKASGYNLKDVYQLNGYSILDRKVFEAGIEDQGQFNYLLGTAMINAKYKRPSMETGFHLILKKYVVHLHPIYTTALLCLENSKELIKQLFSDLDYQYIEYVPPGFDLYQKINSMDKKNIYFLENHGIIISFDDMAWILEVLHQIEDRAKEYILVAGGSEFELSFSDLGAQEKYLFPDGVIFADGNKKEILAAHNYINIVGQKLGTLRSLSNLNIFYLKNLEAEKYRKSL